jgi:hypothetical protein
MKIFRKRRRRWWRLCACFCQIMLSCTFVVAACEKEEKKKIPLDSLSMWSFQAPYICW